MRTVALIDPSINADNTLPAKNIGDEIIFNAIRDNFLSSRGHSELHRFTAHRALSETERNKINSCDLVFFGGTNIVSTDVCHDSRWIPNPKRFFYLHPGIKNLVFLGVGMNRYSKEKISFMCNLRTKLFYKNVLSKKYYHAVRDLHTFDVLRKMGIKNVLFTGCPTLWSLDKLFNFNLETKITKCCFALTDYDPDFERDNNLITRLLQNFTELVYFPQGSKDVDYLQSLESFAKNTGRIQILPRKLVALETAISKEDFVYIGTRLHLGILFLTKGVKSIIVGIDNRAIEMRNSLNIPVILPSEYGLIDKWLDRNEVFGEFKLPIENIERWKNQFTE
jgi:polysaccharide pyruvyl transferase WcaK-like protein